MNIQFSWLRRRQRHLLIGLCVSSMLVAASVEAAIPVGVQIPLWSGAAPGSESWALAEATQPSPNGALLINVSQPTITVFQPPAAVATGTAIVVCQGGGFRTLPDPTVPTAVTRGLLAQGITVVVLKYRLMQNTPEEQAYRAKLGTALTADDINRDLAGDYMKQPRRIASDDGRQAIRLVRAHADELGIKPDRIGMIGFSSGGVLDTTVAIEHDATSRPDFVGTFYGSPPDAVMSVPADAPPHYIATVADDALTWKGALLRFEEWNRAGRPIELHIYNRGGHGFNRGKPGDTILRWQSDFHDWLRQLGYLPKPQS